MKVTMSGHIEKIILRDMELNEVGQLAHGVSPPDPFPNRPFIADLYHKNGIVERVEQRPKGDRPSYRLISRSVPTEQDMFCDGCGIPSAANIYQRDGTLPSSGSI